MCWVVGPAGVGNSAIMQMVAEETSADASVFLSVNGRQDGTKTFNTIAYQLAANYEPYHRLVSKEISRDPTLLRKALPNSPSSTHSSTNVSSTTRIDFWSLSIVLTSVAILPHSEKFFG
jgi:hypothetical protein